MSSIILSYVICADSVKETVTQDHSLEVDGTLLKEKRVVTTYCHKGSEKPWRTETEHTRSISGQSGFPRVSYTVVEFPRDQDGKPVRLHNFGQSDGNVIGMELVDQDDEPVFGETTSMIEDQKASFEKEWDLKWKPA